MKQSEITKLADHLRPSISVVSDQEAGVCDACGGFSPFEFKQIINDRLNKEWGLDETERLSFSSRESRFCAFCGCSYRNRTLARAIGLWAKSVDKFMPLQQLVEGKYLDQFKIAEINSAGNLHQFLKDIPNLRYSEYESSDPQIAHQDLTSLTYKNDDLDLVITSDTLEHVPDPQRALKEIYRVLKPGGAHIFTVPLRYNKKSVTRAKLREGKQVNILSRSYHGSNEPDYLVYTEFGIDFIDMLIENGFETQVLFYNPLNPKDCSGVFVCVKPSKADKRLKKNTYVETCFGNKKEINKVQKSFPGLNLLPIDCVKIHPDIQSEKIKTLLTKIELTQQHADNLEDICKDNSRQIKMLLENNKRLTRLIREFENSRLRRFQKFIHRF